MALESGLDTDSRDRGMEPVAVSEAERPIIQDLQRLLADQSGRQARLSLVAADGRAVPLPNPVERMLRQLINDFVRGQVLTLVPVQEELTSQQAADLLNVSRQYLIRLLEAGEIPYRKTGTHRRLRLEDVLAYKRRRDSERRRGLAELSRMTQEYGGYPELEELPWFSQSAPHRPVPPARGAASTRR